MTLDISDFTAPADPWDAYEQETQAELDKSKQALREITLMLEQSQIELGKLVQRNTAITSQLQQMQGQFDSMPREDIKSTYTGALETQQRLLVMRGQLEKMQSDQANLKRYVEFLDKTKNIMAQNRPAGSGRRGVAGGKSASLDMLIDAQESERQRLSRMMHDGPAQALSNFIVQAEIAARLFDLDAGRAKEELANLKSSAMGTFQKVRGFISELRPMMLDDLGLVPTLRRYVDSFKEQNNVEVNLQIKGVERRLESHQEVMVFRAIQELMGNSVRHNQEQANKIQINITLVIDTDVVRVSVTDNGCGFDPDDSTKTGGLGLKVIRERVELMGGNLDIDSNIGKGCTVSFQVPTIETATA